MVFFEPKIWQKDDITDYWKVHVLNFSEMGNTVFFLNQKVDERWYLLGLFELSLIFQNFGNMVFRVVHRKNYKKILVSFLDNIYLVFLYIEI